MVARADELRYDPVTNHLYHLKDDPPPKNVFIQKRLVKRNSDSSEETLKRLGVYHHQMRSLSTFFRSKFRRFTVEKGIYGHSNELLTTVLGQMGVPEMTRAPHHLKIVVNGLPGSRRQTVAEDIQKKHHAVLVSPRVVINEALSSQSDSSLELIKYIDDIDNIPTEIIGPAIVARLSKPDAVEKGWVLSGFPINREQADYLSQNGIHPNRYFNLTIVLFGSRPLKRCVLSAY